MCRWSLIAGRLPGRTDNEIKNYWNTHIRRKLMNRGIDPVTHRSINQPGPGPVEEVTLTTISFAKEEDQKTSTSGGNFASKLEDGDGDNDDDKSKIKVLERCPDLNLDLKISPPHQQQQNEQQLKTGMRGSTLCFACSLGIQNSKECSCGSTHGTSSSSTGYDFLGLKNGVLEYRSLEMK
ncbi:hypothetical protein LguiB_022396 [Lonicera macranthoides]